MTSLETYQEEITQYLFSKLAAHNVPKHVIMETAQYCVTATILAAQNEARNACRQYRTQMKGGTRRHENSSD